MWEADDVDPETISLMELDRAECRRDARVLNLVAVGDVVMALMFAMMLAETPHGEAPDSRQFHTKA